MYSRDCDFYGIVTVLNVEIFLISYWEKNIEFKDLCGTTFPSSKFSCWMSEIQLVQLEWQSKRQFVRTQMPLKGVIHKRRGGGGFLLSVFIEYPLSLPFLILSNDMEPTIINS